MSDPVLNRISDALDLFNAGRRSEAREAFSAIWLDIETDGDPFHQCVLSHYMAGAQDDPAEELAWNRRALDAANRIGRERPDIASLSVLSLYPLLHLNLADALYRTGDLASAGRHALLAQQAGDALADDDDGRMIRDGIAVLLSRLQQA